MAAYASHNASSSHITCSIISRTFVAIIGSVLLTARRCWIFADGVIFFFTPLISGSDKGWGRTRGHGVFLPGHNLACAMWYNVIVHVTHLPIPLQETGAFNLCKPSGSCGLWLGAKSANDVPLKRIPGYVVGVCALICFFIGVRRGGLACTSRNKPWA